MKCVHTACGDYVYGDQGMSDYISDDDLEGTLGVIRPDSSNSRSGPSNGISSSAKVSREKLLRYTKDSWQSTRIQKLLDLIKPLLADKHREKPRI